MYEIHSNTAILVFALNPSEEVRRKKIRRGKVLFSSLHEHTLTEVKKTRLPFFQFKGACQKGNSFGERFSNAIQHLFDLGFTNVITLGNDCPQLSKRDILYTASKLALGQNVVAPSLDGGFNMLGIQKSAFNKAAFEKLPWQTEKLLDETLKYLRNFGYSPELLRAYSDVDSIMDLRRLLSKVKLFSKGLYTLFSEILRTTQLNWSYLFNTPNLPNFSFPTNKGSPFSIS
ncbi:MAG: DUF2064 domain-containing protein [Bacteroidota bacterium]